jgi:subtilisin family serine protease
MIADHCRNFSFRLASSALDKGKCLAAAALLTTALVSPLAFEVSVAIAQSQPAVKTPARDAQVTPSAPPPARSGTRPQDEAAPPATPSAGSSGASGQPTPSTGSEPVKESASPGDAPAAGSAANDPAADLDKITTNAGAVLATIENPTLTALRLMIVLGHLPKAIDIRVARSEILPVPGPVVTSERAGGLDPADIARLSSDARPGLPSNPELDDPTKSRVPGTIAAAPGPAPNIPGAAAPGIPGPNITSGLETPPAGTQRTDGSRAPTGQVLAHGEQRPREVLVVFSETAKPSAPEDVATALKIDRESAFETVVSGRRIARYRIADDRSLPQVLDLLGKDARIVSAQPNYIYKPLQGAAGKAAPGAQYSVRMLRLADAHRLARGRNVKIALIDTGVDTAHPELAGLRIETFDATGTGRVRADMHGTAMLGIFAGRKQLGGVAPDAHLLVARAVGPEGEATTESILKALAWSFGNGAQVINISVGGPRDPLLEEEIAAAVTRGAIIVAAAGNGGENALAVYPAAYKTVIAVTAVDAADKVYVQANRGNYVAIAAPGVDIATAAPGRAYGSASGTSYAAAHVSGVIALLLEKKPGLKEADVRDVLTRTARKSPGGQSTKDIGAGIVDPVRALESLR